MNASWKSLRYAYRPTVCHAATLDFNVALLPFGNNFSHRIHRNHQHLASYGADGVSIGSGRFKTGDRGGLERWRWPPRGHFEGTAWNGVPAVKVFKNA